MFLQRYQSYFNLNDPSKGGSFYLQSKIYRAKEVLDAELLKEKAEKKAAADAAAGKQPKATSSTSQSAK